jgi:prepilin-type N-terminal cleavage/methylation domain-containing protein
MKAQKTKRGFTLVENIIAVGIFALLAGVVYQTSALLIKSVGLYRENSTVSSLANEYMEIVHNLPYSDIGTKSGSPEGDLPDKPNAATTTVNGANYEIYYVVNKIDDPADGTAEIGNDFASNDYKQVKLYIENLMSGKKYSFSTNIVPRGLESLASGGAIRIKVFGADTLPIPGATIRIQNTTLTPPIDLTRTADANGSWVEVGLKNSVASYQITATKSGHSTDKTYGATTENPNPAKPHSTVSNGLLTDVPLAIDKLSNLTFKTLNQSCAVLSGVGLNVKGAKIIGLPNVLKFDNTYTSNGSGEINLDSIEWDNYTPTPTSASYMIYGSTPPQNIQVLPDTSQEYSLILGPKTTNALLVIVRDAATRAPIEDADVTLSHTGPSYNQTKTTGGSVWTSQNWSGGSGQENFSDATKYFADDGGLETDVLPTALRLQEIDSTPTYVSSGQLISSIFDTETLGTTFGSITWQASQNASTSVKFQIATSETNTATTTWTYTGPNGSGSSYYSTSGETINAPAGQYVRYKVFLDTVDSRFTPALSNVSINYISGCNTPGQVIFTGLSSDSDYEIEVSANGYSDTTVSDVTINGYTTQEILLN